MTETDEINFLKNHILKMNEDYREIEKVIMKLSTIMRDHELAIIGISKKVEEIDQKIEEDFEQAVDDAPNEIIQQPITPMQQPVVAQPVIVIESTEERMYV